jgi:hypothetical protein
MTPNLTRVVEHLGVRFYRCENVELMLVPLLDETKQFTRSAGNGYYMVILLGDPGTSYPLDLRSQMSLDIRYLALKFNLDDRGYGYTPEELRFALAAIASDLGSEDRRNR